MSADPNKKSGRSFQCRDVLFGKRSSKMARELECSVDYLINEAMKQYARQRSYGGASRTPYPAPDGPDGGGVPMMPSARRLLLGASALPPPPLMQTQQAACARFQLMTPPVVAAPAARPRCAETSSLPAASPPMRSMSWRSSFHPRPQSRSHGGLQNPPQTSARRSRAFRRRCRAR